MKKHANKGVKRNKKPLKNKLYRIRTYKNVKGPVTKKFHETHYVNNKVGYIVIEWGYQGEVAFMNKQVYYTDYSLSVGYLKKQLTTKEWSKLCQGRQTEFIVQRRFNKKNI